MNTKIEDRDLTKQAPHSAHDRFGGFAIIGRTVDKCRASMKGKVGEFHYDCPLDNQLFGFKGIKGDEFKTAVSSAKTYEDVATWLDSHGKKKTPDEIKEWSAKVESAKMKDVFAKKNEAEKQELTESCRKSGIDFQTATLFDWLDADDKASFKSQSQMSAN